MATNPIEKELVKLRAKRQLLEAQLVGLRAQEAALERVLRGEPADPANVHGERMDGLEARLERIEERLGPSAAAPAAEEEGEEFDPFADDRDEPLSQGFIDPRPPLEQVRPPKPAEHVQRILGRVPGVDARLEAAAIDPSFLGEGFEEVGLAMGRHDAAEGLASAVTDGYVDTCIAALSIDPDSPIDLTRAERAALRRGLERGHAEGEEPAPAPAPKKRRAPRTKQQPLGGV